jgi:Cu+-exporting ATPase
VLQQAAEIDTVVFDKTGTITEGTFAIIGETPDEVLALAAAVEAGSDHALARVIVEEARRRSLTIPAVENARIHPGRGAEATIDGRVVRVGSAAHLAEHGIVAPPEVLAQADKLGATLVLVDNKGAIFLRDQVRAGAHDAIHELEHQDIRRIVMLTGDRRRAAEAIACEVDIPVVEAELLPEQKLERIRSLMAQGAKVAMAGDGVNDAPALAAAHVGIAMSGASDITAEAADVVYLGRSLERLPELFEVSRRAVATAWQNIIVFAGIVNVVAIGLGATGVMGPLGAAFTHQIASFLVMLNSLRLLRRPGQADGGSRLVWKAKLWASRIEPVEWLQYVYAHRRQALIALAALFVLNGFTTISPNEVGVIERFGRRIPPQREPGLHYKLPWPVESLTRVEARRVRVVEIGFRSAASGVEPAAYEWSAQHRGGRFQRRPDESLMLSGDQNMTELSATVHFRLKQPEDFLFRLSDGEATVRAATESALQAVLSSTPLDEALTTNRPALEARAKQSIEATLARYRAGVEILQVKLLDVHPSIEVVDAFRAVSGAFEEKNRLINEAQAYAGDIVPKARGEARARMETAQGYRIGRANRATGDATRFNQSEAAYRTGPGVTETRLYLETMEEVLPGRKK